MRVDNYSLRGIQHYLDRELEFVVDEVIIDKAATVGIFVANRAKALEKKAERFWKEAQEGHVFEAFIRGVDQYTLFLLVEGISCEINRSDVGYVFYEDLTEAFEIGETIPVKITGITRPSKGQKGKITIDSRTLQEDPWNNIVNYSLNGIYIGEVTRIHPEHGMFVERLILRALLFGRTFLQTPATTSLKKVKPFGFELRKLMRRFGA